MFTLKRKTLFTAAILLSLFLAAMLPLTVFADDGTPSQPEDAPVVVDDPVGDSPTEGESPAVEESANEVSDEELTVPQILDTVPEDTDLVVLDDQGDALPLVTEEAGQALVNGDPMWCPGSALPGSAGCTSSHDNFADLLTDLQTNSATYSGAGTIYIAYDYDAALAGDAGTTVTFDYSSLSLTDALTLQGGWNFSTNKVAGTSTIANTNLLFSGLGGTLTLNDLVFDGGYLRVKDESTADVALNDVTVTNFTVNDDNAAEDVMNAGIGISTTGDIVLNNVNALNNVNGLESTAAAVFAHSASGDVVVNDSSFNDNDGEIGLAALGVGNSTFNNVTATGNQNGVYGVAGNALTVNGGQFNYNGGIGLGASSYGNITLNDVTANGNGTFGALLMAVGDSTVNRGDFSNNAQGGLGWETLGNVTLNNVTATGDTAYGAIVMTTEGDVNVVCGNYNGLEIMAGGNVYLGGPVITGSGLSLVPVEGSVVTFGECPKKVNQVSLGEGGEHTTAPVCNGEKQVTLKAGDAFGVYEKLCGYEFQLTAADVLPGDLPSDATEIAGLLVQLTSGGTSQEVLPTGGIITLKFPVPEGTDAASLVILFWNGSEWVEASNGSVVDGFYVVQVERPGNYILATE
jgi:hypothetical protein